MIRLCLVHYGVIVVIMEILTLPIIFVDQLNHIPPWPSSGDCYVPGVWPVHSSISRMDYDFQLRKWKMQMVLVSSRLYYQST